MPSGGGVFDQREDVMELLDVVSDEVKRWKVKRAEDERTEMEKQKLLGGMPNARR